MYTILFVLYEIMLKDISLAIKKKSQFRSILLIGCFGWLHFVFRILNLSYYSVPQISLFSCYIYASNNFRLYPRPIGCIGQFLPYVFSQTFFYLLFYCYHIWNSVLDNFPLPMEYDFDGARFNIQLSKLAVGFTLKFPTGKVVSLCWLLIFLESYRKCWRTFVCSSYQRI
jgi:hypothetical protein